MTGTGASSPFVKDEPEDWQSNFTNFLPTAQSNLAMNQALGPAGPGSIDPSELSVQSGSYGTIPFGSPQNASSSFNLGFSTEELLDMNRHNGRDAALGDGRFFASPASNPLPMQSMFPDQGQVQSQFLSGPQYNYLEPQSQFAQMSPPMRPSSGHGEHGFVNPRARGGVPHVLDRKASDSRSPMTPKTPALTSLHLGTPESGSFPSQPIHAGRLQHRHHKTMSGQWDSTPASLRSFVDTPITSPSHMVTNPMADVLKSSKHASLPSKVDSGHHAPSTAYQSVEAKRRRRRESHNMVERRRRDNINERIQELSHLVPQHRLEDEKVRKHIANNTPLSPTLAATGMSPPPATSLLAAGGRRATGAGNITMGIPIEDKDKGPNKGDILNGSVSWTRDLMWALHVKLQQEAELADLIARLGGTFPFVATEDEKRLRTELADALERNDVSSFEYSRGHGSGLRVPKHTNIQGEPLMPLAGSTGVGSSGMGAVSPQSLSPGISGGSGTNSAGNQPQFWTNGGRGSLGFDVKEEDEYTMDLGEGM